MDNVIHHLPLLPTGLQDFGEIRKRGIIYVDKTHFIYGIHRLLNSFFLVSPRSFGTSLLLSTFKALFEGKKELFKGSYIYDKFNWETHPIVHLDFSSIGFQDR